MKKFLAYFAIVSTSVFGVSITDTALTSSNSNKNINLRSIRSYSEYYFSRHSASEKWGESDSDEGDEFLEELYEVCSHLNSISDKCSFDKLQYSNWINAIESKNINSLKKLIINCKEDEIPLLILFKYGSEKLSLENLYRLMQSLLSDNKVKKKIKLNTKNKEGEYPLLIAIQNNNEDIFKLLVNNGANANEILSVLIQNNQDDLTKWLIEQKSLKKIKLNINTKNNNGDTASHIAAKTENEKIFDLLVSNKADINVKNKDGQTAREIAILKEFKNYIDKKPEEKKSKKEKETAQITNIIVVEDKEEKQLILEKSLLKLLKQDTVSLFNALFNAIGIGSLKIVKYLVEERKVDINVEGFAGLPLHYAAMLGYIDIVKYFIDYDAKIINKQDTQGDTALHIAAELNQLEIVKLLIENNANPNLENKKGKTPLMKASSKGNEKIVKYLLDHNADPNHENKKGESALIFASSCGHETIVKLLVERGGRR